jgi:hypothetical protein
MRRIWQLSVALADAVERRDTFRPGGLQRKSWGDVANAVAEAQSSLTRYVAMLRAGGSAAVLQMPEDTSVDDII